ATWRATCAPDRPGARILRVDLSNGVTCTGTVRDVSENAVAGVEVRLEELDPFLARRTQADEQGVYTLHGLPPGEFDIVADGDEHGIARAHLAGGAGQVVEWNPALGGGVHRIPGAEVRATASQPIGGIVGEVVLPDGTSASNAE